ncbi:MAG: GAF domain-containing sensor histidine kinase [Planctomycetaceae bacterium]|nr:GAF domain-containing sensor histidine kinase [Planctomycetaceae bacterium]
MESLNAVEELRLLHALTVALDKCESLSSALEIVLREVCKATGWALGEAWLPSPDGNALERGPVWHIASGRLRAFAAKSRDYSFRPGRGLPGRVWSSSRPAWVTDVRRDVNFPRRMLARRAGIKAGFAIPVLASTETIAIIEFFVFEQRREDKRLIQLVTAVAAQLGEIIQRRVAEEALKRSRYELEAENRERERVARELHDGVTQLLGTTLFRVRGLEEAGPNLDPAHIRRVRGLLEQAVQEVRRISTNLAPDVLNELGLCAAVRVLGRDLQEKTGAVVSVTCRNIPPELPREISWAIYRILQEGLHNVEKHARARQARLRLLRRDGWVRAILQDDGKGFRTAAPPRDHDWEPTRGLRNMKHRAEQVGGNLTIRTAPGKGARISVRIPWPQKGTRRRP